MSDREKKDPPFVASFDDDDHTVVDVRSKSGAPVKSDRAVQAEAPLFLGDEDEDDDATEVLLAAPRRSSKSSELARRAIPLDAPKSSPAESTVRAAGSMTDDLPFSDENSGDDRTTALPDLEQARRLKLDDAQVTIPPESKTAPSQLYPPIRDLSDLHERSYGGAPVEHTMSSPKVVKMAFGGKEEKSEGTTTHPQVDLETPVEESPVQNTAPTDTTPPSDPALGTMLIDAPADAVVWIDGNAYPEGPVELKNISRNRRLKVRVARPGFLPWTAQLSLNGKRKSRIRPTLVREKTEH